jgi:His-Xaa-Ser system protein HxsD
VSGSRVVVEFDQGTQSLDALNAAAYRLIDLASCHIQQCESKFICSLSPKEQRKADLEVLRLRFLDLATDENVREHIAVKTEPLRNLILSLAFGALVDESSDKAQ